MSNGNSFNEKSQEADKTLEKRVFEIEINIKAYIKAAYWAIGVITSIAGVLFVIFGINQFNLKKDLEALDKRAEELQKKINASENIFSEYVEEKQKIFSDSNVLC
jgi:hypothetical protein